MFEGVKDWKVRVRKATAVREEAFIHEPFQTCTSLNISGSNLEGLYVWTHVSSIQELVYLIVKLEPAIWFDKSPESWRVSASTLRPENKKKGGDGINTM